MNEAIIYIGAGIIILWGIAHLIPTNKIVKGFGNISGDNKNILAMELVSEGLTLIFLGVLPILITAMGDPASNTAQLVYLTAAVMLLVMAIVTQLTGARTPVIWYKICPLVKTIVAVLYIFGGVL
jgi:hypothetical protein